MTDELNKIVLVPLTDDPEPGAEPVPEPAADLVPEPAAESVPELIPEPAAGDGHIDILESIEAPKLDEPEPDAEPAAAGSDDAPLVLPDPVPEPAEKEAAAAEKPKTPKSAPAKKKKKRPAPVDRMFLDESGEEDHTYTGDELSERDYRPVRLGREPRTGCIGGLMYFVFIVCVSIILACLAWMAASDALALNKESFTTVVNLPSSIFESKTVSETDGNGRVTGTKTVRSADISYISDTLKASGLIQYKWLFELFCRISHADVKVTPGTYELKSSFDYRALIQNMRAGSGATVTIDVTFPEGFTMEQIFRRLEENEVCSYEDLMEAATNYRYNYAFLEGMLPGNAIRLEGFLFPDTYQFFVGMQASSAINKFLETFYYLQTADMVKQVADRGMTMREIVTIASLIEKEAAVDADNRTDDRALIASVIYNRLEAGMPLGIDASILYVFPEHEGAPSTDLLAFDSPYNTRLHTGLPPTPICNPGQAALKAALSPAESEYYYYALNTATGMHEFFTNADDFNAFVATQSYG